MLEIEARAPVSATEDREKVLKSLLSLVPDGEVAEDGASMTARSSSGERLRELIWNGMIRDTARSALLRGRSGNEVVVDVSKQAAFMGRLSFQEGRVALGPITLTIRSDDMDAALDYLAESTIGAVE